MNTVRDVLAEKTKGNEVYSVAPETTVVQAVKEMCRLHIGALLVVDRAVPVGIVSERDVMTRVVSARLDPAVTVVREIMTEQVVCIEVERPLEEAMAVMSDKRVRHLPTVRDGRVVGIVSLGDLARSVSRSRDYELKMVHEYVEGRYPG